MYGVPSHNAYVPGYTIKYRMLGCWLQYNPCNQPSGACWANQCPANQLPNGDANEGPPYQNNCGCCLGEFCDDCWQWVSSDGPSGWLKGLSWTGNYCSGAPVPWGSEYVGVFQSDASSPVNTVCNTIGSGYGFFWMGFACAFVDPTLNDFEIGGASGQSMQRCQVQITGTSLVSFALISFHIAETYTCSVPCGGSNTGQKVPTGTLTFDSACAATPISMMTECGICQTEFEIPMPTVQPGCSGNEIVTAYTIFVPLDGTDYFSTGTPPRTVQQFISQLAGHITANTSWMSVANAGISPTACSA
jgi:hypothetical protein